MISIVDGLYELMKFSNSFFAAAGSNPALREASSGPVKKMRGWLVAFNPATWTMNLISHEKPCSPSAVNLAFQCPLESDSLIVYISLLDHTPSPAIASPWLPSS